MTDAPSLADRTAGFFDSIRRWGIVRSDERWFGGVAAGVARSTGLDPLLVRGLWVVLTVVSGVGLLLYGLGWLLLPQTDGRIHAQEALSGRFSAGLVFGLVVTLAGLGGENRPGPDVPDGLVVGLLVVGAVLWLNQRRSSGSCDPHWPGHGRPHGPGHDPAHGPTHGPTPDPTQSSSPDAPWYGPGQHPATPGSQGTPQDTVGGAPAAPGAGSVATATWAPVRPPDTSRPLRALTSATLGLAVLLAGLVVLWDVVWGALPGRTPVLALAAALGAVSVGVVAAGLVGRRSGGLAPVGVLLAVALVATAAMPGWDGVQAVGQRTDTPRTAAAAESGASLGVGELVVDLTDPGILTGATTADPVEAEANVGVGSLVVRVPRGVATVVDAQLGLGSAAGGPGQPDEAAGPSTSQSYRTGSGAPVLRVQANVGVGQVQVVEVGAP